MNTCTKRARRVKRCMRIAAAAAGIVLAVGCGSTQKVVSASPPSQAEPPQGELRPEIDFLTKRSSVIAADCASLLKSAGEQAPPTTTPDADTSEWVRVGAAPGCISGLVQRSVLDDPTRSSPIPAVATEGGSDIVGYYLRGVGLLSPSEMNTQGIEIDRLAEASAIVNDEHD